MLVESLHPCAMFYMNRSLYGLLIPPPSFECGDPGSGNKGHVVVEVYSLIDLLID